MDSSQKLFFSFITQIKNQKQGQAVLKTIDNNQYTILKNISINILKGLIPLNENQREILKKDRNFVRKLAAGEVKPTTIAQHWKTIRFMINLTQNDKNQQLHQHKQHQENGTSTNRRMGTNSGKIIRTAKFEPETNSDSESEYEFSTDDGEDIPKREEDDNSNEFVARKEKKKTSVEK